MEGEVESDYRNQDIGILATDGEYRLSANRIQVNIPMHNHSEAT